MKRIVLLIVFWALLVGQIWAEGTLEGHNQVHPGARMILEEAGYRFDSENNPISYKNRPIERLSNQTNPNPHSYDKNTIYKTNFDVNQWVGKSILATTGNATLRQVTNEMSMNALGFAGFSGTRIFIKDIPDKFLKGINSSVQNAFLVYAGAQTFQMADGSAQVFPVFQLIEFFDDTVAQAIRTFNNAFEAGIYKTEDGFQYSKIKNRTFARDIATKKELYEWNGSQWILLIEE